MPLDSTIVISFNEPMKCQTLNTNTFKLLAPGKKPGRGNRHLQQWRHDLYCDFYAVGKSCASHHVSGQADE